MFSFHPMSLLRAFFLFFVAAELVFVVVLLIEGIPMLYLAAIRGAIFMYNFISVAF